MEPGGQDDLASYEAWLTLGGSELVDCRAHHMAHDDPAWTRWHLGDRPPTQPTWRRLIQLLLAFQMKRADLNAVKDYQRQQWGSATGETALIEVSAVHSPRLSRIDLNAPEIKSRLDVIHDRMLEFAPTFAVLYGIGYQHCYEQIIGTTFDSARFAQVGATLCALTPGPTSARGKPWGRGEWWIEKGVEIRKRLS